MSEQQTEPDFEEFLRRYCEDELQSLWMEYPSRASLWIDYQDLLTWNYEVADALLGESPRFSREGVLEDLGDAACRIDPPVDVRLDPEKLSIRFRNFGEESLSVGEYWSEDLGEYRSVSGQIANATDQRVRYTTIVWECLRCQYETEMPQQRTSQGDDEPPQCASCERQGPFRKLEGKSEGVDYQLLRLEQPAEERASDTSPKLDVRVEGGLLKHLDQHNVNSGSRITVNGYLKKKEEEDGWVMEANAVEIDDDDLSRVEPEPEEKERIRAVANGEEGDPYELLVDSIAPSLVGSETIDGVEYQGEEKPKLWWIKLTSALAGLFRGWRRPNGDGTYQRGTSHTLLIGDPSTGKSTILDAIASLSPRSAMTSGKGASAAGLTAAAVNDDFDGNNWTLEAGALVKGHKGVAAVDELDKMKEDAVSSLHRALESQEINISKAGINATLPCETALVAAANPRDSRFNQYEDQHSQFDLVDSLLDRFDLIFTLTDKPNQELDEEIAEHVISTRMESGRAARGDIAAEESGSAPYFDEEFLRKYVAYTRDNCRPILADESVKDALVEFYVEIRSHNQQATGGDDDEDGAVPATTRSLEGVLRLAEAAARVEFSDEITMRHAQIAIAGVRASLQDIGYDPETGVIDWDAMHGGTSHKDRDERSRLQGIIRELSPPGSGGAPLEDVRDAAASAGIENPEYVLEKLLQQGRIYEPANNEYRVNE